MVGWLIGSFGGELDGWMVDWMVGWVGGWLDGWVVDWMIGWVNARAFFCVCLCIQNYVPVRWLCFFVVSCLSLFTGLIAWAFDHFQHKGNYSDRLANLAMPWKFASILDNLTANHIALQTQLKNRYMIIESRNADQCEVTVITLSHMHTHVHAHLQVLSRTR